jgi:hypothetical protein
MKSKPFNVKLSLEAHQLIADAAVDLGQSKTAIIENAVRLFCHAPDATVAVYLSEALREQRAGRRRKG